MTFKQHRFEMLAVIVASIGLTVAALMVTQMLSSVTTPHDCFESSVRGEPLPVGCDTLEEFNRINYDVAGTVMAAMAVLPWAAGLVIGVVLVGVELDHRTASLGWWLARSRRRWLLMRAVPVAMGLALVLALPAWAAEVLGRTRHGLYDPATTTTLDYGLRGYVVVAKGLAAFGIGLFFGAILGRLLPALISAGVAAVILIIATAPIQYPNLPPERIESFEDLDRAGIYYVLHTWTLDRATGQRVDDDQYTVWQQEDPERAAADVDGAAFRAWFDERYVSVSAVVTGDRYAFIPAQESLLMVGLAVALVGATVVVVERKRVA